MTRAIAALRLMIVVGHAAVAGAIPHEWILR